jgi:hypothetical protein
METVCSKADDRLRQTMPRARADFSPNISDVCILQASLGSRELVLVRFQTANPRDPPVTTAPSHGHGQCLAVSISTRHANIDLARMLRRDRFGESHLIGTIAAG